ncbi:MAG: cation diffusion facilitator family transporter [bacterium]|nr:cation diffusion facilitator family transporter [bacterium]
MDTTNEKQFGAFLSVCSNALLITIKLTVGFFTGSLSIISEALHSLSDIAASFIAFVMVKKSSKPADDDHPFGHGKYEELSGFLEGGLIFAIALFILYSAVKKFIHPQPFEFEPLWGIIVMAVSVIVNIFVSTYLFKIGQKTNSIAITADAEHLKTDVLSSMAVLVGLLMVKITGLSVIDTIFAFLVGLIIAVTGIKVTFSAVKGLLDEALPQEDLDIIKGILDNHLNKDVVDVRFSKTRKSGSEKLIELVITVHKNMTVGMGHEICNKLEKEIEAALNGASVFIHIEPCADECTGCKDKY